MEHLWPMTICPCFLFESPFIVINKNHIAEPERVNSPMDFSKGPLSEKLGDSFPISKTHPYHSNTSTKLCDFFIWVVGGPRKRLRVNVPFPLDLCILPFKRNRIRIPKNPSACTGPPATSGNAWHHRPTHRPARDLRPGSWGSQHTHKYLDKWNHISTTYSISSLKFSGISLY